MKSIIDEQEPHLTSLNHPIYASAVISTELCNVKIKAAKRNVPKKLAWQERIQKQINTLRSDLETLKNVRNNNSVKISKLRKWRSKYKIKYLEEIQNVLEKIKQTIQAKAASLRQYQKRACFYKDNNLFKNNTKQFSRNNGKSQIKINKAPSEEEIHSFWEKIWSDSKTHNSQAPWIEKLSKKIPKQIPQWLVNGITYLLPKSDETNNPQNYRPITCLTTMYKILTSILTE